MWYLILFFISVTVSLRCNFDTSECEVEPHDPWIITDRIYLPNIFNGPPAQLSAVGHFACAQGRFGSDPIGNITGPWFLGSQVKKLLNFVFSKSTHSTKLNIILETNSETRVLDSVIGVGLLQWNKKSVVVPPFEGNGRIVFQACGIENSFDVIAIDDVELDTDGDPFGAKRRRQEVRRSPVTSDQRLLKDKEGHCRAVTCNFKNDACAWTASDLLHVVSGKIVLDGQASGVLASEPAILPVNSHFQMDIFSSDSSQCSIFLRSGSSDEIVWSQSGVALNGWNTIRIPIKYSHLPTQIVIKSVSQSGGFVAISHTDIVDERGRQLFCGVNTPVIRPREEGTQRLTAVQQLGQEEEIETKKTPQPISSISSSFFGQPSSSTISRSSFASLPISPSHVLESQRNVFGLQNTGSVVQPLSLSQPEPQKKVPSMLSRSTNRASTSIDSQSANTFVQNSVVERQLTTSAPFALQPQITTYAPRTTASPSVADLLSVLGGQPIMEGQLKFLAKKFGFDNLSGERAQQALSLFRKFMSNKQLNLPKGMTPILPINAETNGGDQISNEKVEIINRLPALPSQATINSELAKKFSGLFSLPQTQLDDARPLTRQNLDFIVQNAYNKLIEKN